MAAPTNVAEGAVKGLKEAFNSMDKGQMIAEAGMGAAGGVALNLGANMMTGDSGGYGQAAILGGAAGGATRLAMKAMGKEDVLNSAVKKGMNHANSAMKQGQMTGIKSDANIPLPGDLDYTGRFFNKKLNTDPSHYESKALNLGQKARDARSAGDYEKADKYANQAISAKNSQDHMRGQAYAADEKISKMDARLFNLKGDDAEKFVQTRLGNNNRAAMREFDPRRATVQKRTENIDKFTNDANAEIARQAAKKNPMYPTGETNKDGKLLFASPKSKKTTKGNPNILNMSDFEKTFKRNPIEDYVNKNLSNL